MQSVAGAIDVLDILQLKGIVSVGHQALLVCLNRQGESLEDSLGEAAVAQGPQRQDALQQSVHLGDGVLHGATQNLRNHLLELQDLTVVFPHTISIATETVMYL